MANKPHFSIGSSSFEYEQDLACLKCSASGLGRCLRQVECCCPSVRVVQSLRIYGNPDESLCCNPSFPMVTWEKNTRKATEVQGPTDQCATHSEKLTEMPHFFGSRWKLRTTSSFVFWCLHLCCGMHMPPSLPINQYKTRKGNCVYYIWLWISYSVPIVSCFWGLERFLNVSGNLGHTP